MIDRLLERAKKAGFTEAEALLERGEQRRVKVFGGEVDEYAFSLTEGLGFRGLYGGRMGYAYTERMDEEGLEFLICSAKAGAGLFSGADPEFLWRPEEDYPAVPRQKDIGTTAEQSIADALALEQGVSAAGLKAESAVVGSGEGGVRLVNTLGLDESYQSHVGYAYVGALDDGGGETVSGGESWEGESFDDFSVETLVRQAVQDTLDKRGARPCATGSWPVGFSNLAMVGLMQTFWGVFSAQAAQKGLSLLKGRLGERMASPLVTLVDDPFLPGGLGNAPFDGEGVPTAKKTVVDRGVFTTFLHNLVTAKKDGVVSTGNASRSAGSAKVGISPFNLYLAPGELTREGIYGGIHEGLFVTEMMGHHAGANAISGDFSLLAKGFWIKNGGIDHPVNQVTVAGNFYELMKRVAGVGRDLRFDTGGASFGSPSLWVESLHVTGA
ncbi:TldD/PmbA family protein [Gehongia tenuis]|uniref:TldD/PmbA family protein n=1 Tax=Gehongia tenuis TaxID=2763655 RepID=A0A926D544_9FIRM|nr:TldD/PmbA family protein [Gehongia tenuis]MBC8531431.1 TldD/PmbA family protein [Gehongia tenuis]